MPPSVNKYWRVGEVGNRGKFLTKSAKVFRINVQAECLIQQLPRFTGPVISVLEFHPDGRMCDLDNYEKALWDAVQAAGILYNDCQVVCVLRYWTERRKQRGVTLRLAPLLDAMLLDSVPDWSLNQAVAAVNAQKRLSKKRNGGDAKQTQKTAARKSRSGKRSGEQRRNKYPPSGQPIDGSAIHSSGDDQ